MTRHQSYEKEQLVSQAEKSLVG